MTFDVAAWNARQHRAYLSRIGMAEPEQPEHNDADGGYERMRQRMSDPSARRAYRLEAVENPRADEQPKADAAIEAARSKVREWMKHVGALERGRSEERYLRGAYRELGEATIVLARLSPDDPALRDDASAEVKEQAGIVSAASKESELSKARAAVAELESEAAEISAQLERARLDLLRLEQEQGGTPKSDGAHRPGESAEGRAIFDAYLERVQNAWRQG
jgi:hypothetical protein